MHDRFADRREKLRREQLTPDQVRQMDEAKRRLQEKITKEKDKKK